MKITLRMLPAATSVVLFCVFALTSPAPADEGTCYLQAQSEAYLEVFDLDREGNQGSLLWQGRLKEGQTVLIKAPHGRFRYNYNDQPDKRQALSSGEDRWCDGKNTVGVP